MLAHYRALMRIFRRQGGRNVPHTVSSNPSGTLKRCTACAEQIQQEATLCHHCSSYQKKWKNWMPQIGAAIALLTFVASVLLSASDHIQRIYLGAKISVLSLSPSQFTILNDGGEEVLVQYLEIRSERPICRFVKEINQLIPKGAVSKIPLGGPGGAVPNQANLVGEKVPKGYAPAFHLKGGATLSTMKESLDRSVTFPGSATLSYRSTRSPDKKTERFAVEGILIKLSTGTK